MAAQPTKKYKKHRLELVAVGNPPTKRNKIKERKDKEEEERGREQDNRCNTGNFPTALAPRHRTALQIIQLGNRQTKKRKNIESHFRSDQCSPTKKQKA
mgnify:CR=1 FL=1